MKAIFLHNSLSRGIFVNKSQFALLLYCMSTIYFGVFINKSQVTFFLLYHMSTIYELYSKSNETGVIKTLLKNIEIYRSQIPSKNHVFLLQKLQ